MEKVLIVSSTGMGDCLWGTPGIRALKKTFPEMEIDLVVRFQGVCRGRRAWHAGREALRTWETPCFPEKTGRANQLTGGRLKEQGESDRVIVL